MCFTLHGASSPIEIKVIREFTNSNIHFVSISNNQRRDYKGLNFIGTVYNGININKFPFNENANETMAFAGRINRQKGFEIAIEVASVTGRKLLIRGDIRASEKEYYKTIIDPLVKEKQ